MFKKKAKEEKTYGIVGLGRFGYALAMELAESEADFIVLDQDEDKIREMREYTDSAFIVKSLDKKTLAETGIQNCDVAIVCIGEQIDTSILTTLNLTTLGVPKVIAKAKSHEHGEILEKLGAEVVFPERDMANRLAHRLEASRALDYINLSEKLNISKILAPKEIVGKTVLDANLRGRFGVNIIAIENGDNITENVAIDYVFTAQDILYICGNKQELDTLMDLD